MCNCNCTSKRLRVSSVIFTVLGLALLGVGVWLPRMIDTRLQDGLRDQLLVTRYTQASYTDGYRHWEDNSADDAPNAIYYQVYALNVTNHIDVVQHGAKPILNQTGPYVYRQITKRFNVVWSNDSDGNPIVTWTPWIYYLFDRARTPADLDPDAYMYSANIPLQGIVSVKPSEAFLALPALYAGYHDYDILFTKRRVHEIIFGYVDEVLAKIPGQDPLYPGLVLNETWAQVLRGPRFTMQTGENDWSSIRQYAKWGTPQIAKGYEYLQCNNTHSKDGTAWPAWQTDDANFVHGSDGLQFPPGVQQGSTLTQWFDVMYRTVSWTNYNNTEVDVGGITLYRFGLPPNLFANATKSPSNAQYNAYGPSGFMNITSCVLFNVPIYLSKPHFLEVDHDVANLVQGLSANVSIHDSFLDVEPITGLAMRAAKRLQINAKLQHIPTIAGDWFTKINQHLMLPMVWIDGGSTIPDASIKQFKNSVYLARTIHDVSYYAGFAAGNFFALIGLIMFGYATVVRGREVERLAGAAQRLVSPAEDDEEAGPRYKVHQPSGYRSTG